MRKQTESGFSLIELMVALAIIGILMAIAVPSYSKYQVRGSRAAAQTELLQIASLQEKIYLNSSAYTTSITTAYNGRSDGGLGRTAGKTSDGKYELSCSGCTTQVFELRARPATGTAQVGDGCLSIKENGLRQWHEGKDACDAATPKNW